MAILWHAGAAILILGYAAFRMYALGSFMRTTSEGVSLFPFLYSGLSFAGLYIGKTLFPLPLNAFYHFNLPLSFTISWAGLLLCLSALILVYAFRKNRVVVLGFIWFGLFLGPALVLKDVSPVLFAERYLYLPSAGFILAVVAFAYSRERSDRSKRYFSYFMIAVAIFFAGVTYARSIVWRDDLTLWSDTAEKSPQSVTVQYNLGTAYLKSKQYQQASIHYIEAIRQDPQKPDAYYNLAICQYWLGQKQSAAESLKKFLRYAPASHPMKKDAEQKLQQLQASKAARPVE